ncbi:MAG: diguanylate phosphodiesterase [Sphingomonadales bacterium 32-68-7]|nr:MAG: diguanylate phosphodiesterase [Sphingomonadales bacterium 12-68-11]OYX08030.1 MAG: diguanylate phosphodiesterase [Sphingomonadales bacterium 32-68-7]
MAGCSGCADGKALPFALAVAFQPIVDLETGLPYAYEALIRGPEGQSAAWVLGQIDDETRYRFDQACRVAAITQAVDAGLLTGDAKLSINFMPNAVYSPMACIQLTLKTARKVGLPIDRLIFEFTENEKIDPDHVRAIVEAYRALGFATAIDDFGAGHAGLGLLANLQTDWIKIDMGLIRGVDASKPRRQIVDATVRLVRELGIAVIAEGVETAGELAVLRDIGVRYVQGFYLARPALGRLPMPDLDPRQLRAA